MKKFFLNGLVVLMAMLLFQSAYAIDVTTITPFELDADSAPAPNPDNDALGVYDWAASAAGGAYGPGFCGVTPGAVCTGAISFSGIALTVDLAKDGHGGTDNCSTRSFPTIGMDVDANTYEPSPENFDDDPWPAPTGSQVSSKPDFCYFFTASEIVTVPASGGAQNHTLVYMAMERNLSATGAFGFSLPLFDPVGCKPDGGQLINFESTGSGTGTVELLEWSQTGTCDPNVPDSGTATGSFGPSTLDDSDEFWECSVRADKLFMECVFDFTQMGLVPENECVSVGIPGIISRSSPAITNAMQDFAGRTSPLTIENCGELNLIKDAGYIDPGAQVQFGYEAVQLDLAPAYDDSIIGDGDPTVSEPDPHPGFGQHRTRTGDCSLSVGACNRLKGEFVMPPYSTDDWENVIAQPDYWLDELLANDWSASPPALAPNGDNTVAGDWLPPVSILCDYTNVYTLTNPADPTSFERVLAHDVTPPVTALDGNFFPVVPNPFFGVLVEPTVCTITNGSTNVPVTINSFHASNEGGGVRFEWSTLTEVNNVGFYLFVQEDAGEGEDKIEWKRLEFVPSTNGDSITLQHYIHVVDNVEGKIFAIADVASNKPTRPNMHGPYELEQQYGDANVEIKAIDWQNIRSMQDVKKKARIEKRKLHMEQKMNKLRGGAKPKKPKKTSMLENLGAYIISGVLSVLVPEAHAAEAPSDVGVMYMEVEKEGIYRVTYEELLAAGVDLAGISKWSIKIRNNGEQVYRMLKGQNASNGDVSIFGPGGWVEFIGTKLDTLYTSTNIFEVYVQADGGVLNTSNDRTSVPNGTPATYYMETVRAEPQLKYGFASPNGDPWYAERMLASGGTAYSKGFTIDVDGYLNGMAPVTVGVEMWGETNWPADNDHHVVLSFNGAEIADELFDGLVDHPVSGETDALLNGANTLNVTLPMDTGQSYDLVNLDAWSVTFPREFIAIDGQLSFTASGELFQVNGLPGSWVRVYRVNQDGTQHYIVKSEKSGTSGNYSRRFVGTPENATYYIAWVYGMLKPNLVLPPVTEDITSGLASYLVISHPDFIGTDAMNQLQTLRENGGYSVKVVDTEQIYAQFGHGIFGAQPIKDYIAYAAANMDTEMVHIIGGDTYDYQNFTGSASVSFVPSLYVATGQGISFAPSDPAYADLDNDNIPDIAIGRTPARTVEEFAALVGKIASYGGSHSSGETSVFAADKKDGSYSFSADSDAMIAKLPSGWQQASNLTKAYVDELGDADAHTTLLNALNDGPALASFAGHSSLITWGGNWYSPLLSRADAANLTNHGNPTVVTQWGCWNTYYVSPSENTMAHEFMLNGDQGAVAVLGASTLTKASTERQLGIEIYKRMFTSGMPIGTAVLEAKQALANYNSNALDVILGWQLLGDPALVIQY